MESSIAFFVQTHPNDRRFMASRSSYELSENDVVPIRRGFSVEEDGRIIDLSYLEWGDPANPKVVICAHGLTRNAHDFDFLARALVPDFRVVCPDAVGRGQSGWLADSTAYAYPTYVAHAGELLKNLGTAYVGWVGTSMGGLTGMMLAAAAPEMIASLVLNDIGPRVARRGLRRLAGYVGDDRRFSDVATLEQYLRGVLSPFGSLPDAHWRYLADHSSRPLSVGGMALAYDPAIAEGFRDMPDEDVELWEIWDQLDCPVLLLRGAESDILAASTASDMTARGPGARLVTYAGIGHCPMLMDNDQIALVKDWLEATPWEPIVEIGGPLSSKF